MKRIFPRIVAALALAAAASVASAQTAQTAQRPNTDARQALSRFPGSQAVLYVNANRLINVAMPRVMPKAEYQKMVDEAKKGGVDVRGLDYVVFGLRVVPAAAQGGAATPEVAAMLRGSFNANSLLVLARTIAGDQAKFREETYGSKTLLILEMPKKPDAAVGMGEGGEGTASGESTTGGGGSTAGGEGSTAGGGGEGSGGGQSQGSGGMSFSFPEVAAVALDANTLVVGVPSYVKAAIDAGAGSGGLSPVMLDMAARDPNALMSLTADLPENLPEYVKQFGLDTNEEVRRILGWLRSVNLSTGMDEVNFTSRVAVLTTGPEQAATLDGMLQFGLTAAVAALRQEVQKKRNDPNVKVALAALQSLTHTTQGGTLEVGVSVPQAAVAEMVRREMSKGAAKGRTPGQPRQRGARKGGTRRR
ncbi:MAG TPA: hypothetical protein VEY09_09630 [Pyrinomonadaceae bacterium]|nr:hypothetical protein [Pyrinomonadaceae bacterium]